MIIERRENLHSDFQGTIIDIETIGEFNRGYPPKDSRRYKDIKQVIFGYIQNDYLQIYCAKQIEAIELLKQKTIEIINNLQRPFYSFNCDFESGVWFHHLGIQVEFDGELTKEKFEKKADTVRQLKIPNYDDPFYDNGLLCMLAWNKSDLTNAIAHNRACLLKERDILIKRKSRQPDGLQFVR